jgi:hypothetical protein
MDTVLVQTAPVRMSSGSSRLAGEFFEAPINLLRQVQEEESENLTTVGTAVTGTVEAGGSTVPRPLPLPPRPWSPAH